MDMIVSGMIVAAFGFGVLVGAWLERWARRAAEADELLEGLEDPPENVRVLAPDTLRDRYRRAYDWATEDDDPEPAA